MPPEAKSPLKQAKNRLHNFFINLSEKLHEKLKIPQVAKDYNCFSVEIRKF